MSIFFISRHAGAREWARAEGIAVDVWVDHLELDRVQPGDQVLGTLPVHTAAAICQRGARYFHLALDLPASARGRELSADELRRYGARLTCYQVSPVDQAPGSA